MSEIDLATLVFIPVITLIAVIIFATITTETTNGLNYSLNLSAEQQEIIAVSKTLPEIYDWIGALSVFFLLFASIVSAFFVRSHPIFFVFFFIFSIAMLVLSGYFSDMYETVISQQVLNETASDFTMSTYVIKQLPIITLIGSLLIAISMFAKPSNDF